MKPASLLAASLLLAAAPLLPAQSPSPSPAPAPSAAARTAPRREPVGFLGLVTAPASAVLSSQLGLPEGFGLVVDRVVPDSPAAAAGLKKNDILTVFGDQRLVSPSQLATLVRAQAEGAEVSLTFVRAGKEQKASAKIVRRAEDERGGSGRWPAGFRFNFEGMPQVEDILRELPDMLGEAARRRLIVRDGERDERRRASDLRLDRARLTWKDDQGEVEIWREDGKKMVTIRQPDGTVKFTGSVTTPEERAKLTAELRARLDRVESARPPTPPVAPVAPVAPVPPVPPVAPIAPVAPSGPTAAFEIDMDQDDENSPGT